MFRKNKNPEKTDTRARNTPFGSYCYALTDKEHSRIAKRSDLCSYLARYGFCKPKINFELFP
uniref:Uncharacterized protein n=1 Tax=Candidatus Kentrum sp. SD TaxID=2126332 RepID=A0A450YIZ5_9GAMM|nr:MAG: hypothetical protein BECKSD772F_GA0070984_101240 [Candidatus Kentron sp. SD]VFK41532.1 MAG: hypothetical protein BECKSD772E_GA0070983_101239 [Candidatus Kentron sp. SD]VFK78513.1 MAG: hypothetical protein BECKSD772D_GA0070982_101636 [Candidatus Kentron sp. SD]